MIFAIWVRRTGNYYQKISFLKNLLQHCNVFNKNSVLIKCNKILQCKLSEETMVTFLRWKNSITLKVVTGRMGRITKIILRES